MGGITVDSGLIISLEREGYSARESVAKLRLLSHDEDLTVSAIVYTELLYGLYRAESRSREAARRQYVQEIFRALEVESFTRQTAEMAAALRGEQMRLGNTLPFADSLIAATALSLRKPLLTTNLRDFVRIPGLTVIPFQLA